VVEGGECGGVLASIVGRVFMPQAETFEGLWKSDFTLWTTL